MLDLVNDYYQNKFPFEANVQELRDFITQLLEPTDSGEYTVAATVLKILEPVLLDGSEIRLWLDEDQGDFFEQWPKDTGSAFVINDAGAGLAVGTSSTSAVKNGNEFYYDIAGDSYVEAVDTETELSGDTIPQNKYGAWRLEIDTDGTVSIVEADDNATGYDTPGQAIQGIAVESSTKAAMGYVTAINTASGGFVPGTTSLSAGTVTATFTDGFNSSRQRPEGVLYYGTKLFVRPKSDDWHELKYPYIVKPTALTTGTAPTDIRWGPAIASGAALDMVTERNDSEKMVTIALIHDKNLRALNKKFLNQKSVNRTSVASF
jgi:hypothetical protein